MKKLLAAVLAAMLLLAATALADEPSALDIARERLAAANAGETVDLRDAPLTVTEYAAIKAEYPETRFRYSLSLYGVVFADDAEHLDFGDTDIRKIKELKAGLDLLPNAKQADMYGAHLSRDSMAELYERYPGMRWGWILTLGSHKIRTDITAFSSMHSPSNTHYSSGYYSALKYCYQLQALDLGHNKLTDLSFLETMTDLRLLILADNQIRDISPLAKLTKLEYVELFMNKIKDISPLAGMQSLLDVNLCYNRIADYSPLLSCPKLERLWCSHNNLDKDAVAKLEGDFTGVELNTTCSGSTEGGWRVHPRYDVLHAMFNKQDMDNWVYIPFTEAQE